MNSPLQPKPYRVLKNVRESPDTFTLRVAMPINHDPGQFVQVSYPGYGESAISISSDSRKYIDLTIHEVGNVTKELAKVRMGDTLLVRGPYGRGYPMKYLKGNNIIIIGGGCGVAPLKGIIEYLEHHREDYKDVHLFLGYRSPNDILFQKELEEWKNKYKLTVTVDQNPSGQFCYDAKTGFVTNSLKESGITNNNAVAMLCGPPVMMNIATGILKEKGFHDDQIFVSAERLMYCGIGICSHCMIRGKYTCIDGPVFRYDDIGGLKND
jgi:anaerobic sulfite reductase subunit B